MRHIWSGDEDLCDGKLQALYSEYIQRREFVDGLGLRGRRGMWEISSDLYKIESELMTDIDFISSGTTIQVQFAYSNLILLVLCLELSSANRVYSSKLESGMAAEKSLRKMAWNVDDLSHLHDEGRQLIVCSRQLQELADGDQSDFQSANVPQQLTQWRKKMLAFLQGVYRFRRTVATHIFVLMISPEQRDRKPYALPVQCVPYASMKHSTCRSLVNGLVFEMKKRGMKVAGMHKVTKIINLFLSNEVFVLQGSLQMGSLTPLDALETLDLCQSCN